MLARDDLLRCLLNILVLFILREEQVVEGHSLCSCHVLFDVGGHLAVVRLEDGVFDDLVLQQQLRVVGEALGRMTLTDHVQRLLGVAQNYLTAGFEAGHAYRNNLAHGAAVVPEISDALLVLYDAADA